MATYGTITPSTDVITNTSKVTTGFFTGNKGSLAGGNLVTASLSATQKNYYYNLQYSSEDQLSVTYGHVSGSGSTANAQPRETKAIYKQFASLLLDDPNGNFFINSTTEAEENVYIIVAERSRMKDRLNRKNFTIQLSGSWLGAGDKLVKLTDDSDFTAATQTAVGPRYNILSGSEGVLSSSLTMGTNLGGVNGSSNMGNPYYGHFYPNMGIMVLSGKVLSQSLGGSETYRTSSNPGLLATQLVNGLNDDIRNDGNADNAIKLVHALEKGTQTLRGEEDQTTKSYFCRALANDFNFTNNPTFVSGSDSIIRHPLMVGDPQVYITTVGLYTAGGGGQHELVAVGKLSTPVQKNYGTEATIKVKLTY